VAWRNDGGVINDSQLIIRRLATDTELKELQNQINANTVVRLKARIAREKAHGRPEALLESIDGETRDDKELNARLNDLLMPVSRSDTKFGIFIRDRCVPTCSYSVETKWLGDAAVLTLVLDEISEFDRALKRAHELWADSVRWNKLVLDCLDRDVLCLKSWPEDDCSTLSREEFESRITLRVITVRPDGDFGFWYHDDNLFLGHDIAAKGKLNAETVSGGIYR
jgi:hypothetical protein